MELGVAVPLGTARAVEAWLSAGLRARCHGGEPGFAANRAVNPPGFAPERIRSAAGVVYTRGGPAAAVPLGPAWGSPRGAQRSGGVGSARSDLHRCQESCSTCVCSLQAPEKLCCPQNEQPAVECVWFGKITQL